MVLQFFNNHFEIIVLFNGMLLAGGVAIYVLLKIKEIRPGDIREAFHTFLYYTIMVAEALLFVLMVSVFANNLSPKAPLDLDARVRGTTDWVRERLTIFFIAENDLVTISPQGHDRQVVFSAANPIRSYHFSPDGKKMLILTDFELYLYDLAGRQGLLVDSWRTLKAALAADAKGTIGRVLWSPRSDRFCYRVSRWTPVSGSDQWMIYQLETKEKRALRNPGRRLDELIWDREGENLYFLWFDALDTTIHGTPFLAKVYQVPLQTLIPTLAVQFPFDEAILPAEHLSLRGIQLYEPRVPLSFGRGERQDRGGVTRNGSRIGIDEHDHLYYQRGAWWKQRLYQVPRVMPDEEFPHHQYRGGDLAVSSLRWLPGGRYVILAHNYFGILILEPSTGKIGILDNERGDTFGWYQPADGRP